MNVNLKNPLIKIAFLVIFFYLLFIISRYLRIAPTVVSLLMPLGILFLDKWQSIIFSFVLLFLTFLSGFFVEVIGIFLLFFIPIIVFKFVKNNFLKHLFISIFSFSSFFVMYYFFGDLLPDFIENKSILTIIIFIYILFCNFYGYLLERLKLEIKYLLNNILNFK
ncbi:hypothetical protein [Petrotoga sp. 9PWA.NaAc.5.4]|uniref:hypothetical protein n=1 Tax=Petrotoga sp. 9PWA.NaAc.5.4 TaxID=1434328 RepID=UPI000CBA11A5|nr:hypothetical protein [Petrotoga sp. 9PWA.NaAc.5.4]PNR92549.1 hypothetical protein X924_09250 [Petrotoga sp. 9PWA.NaAc.5.4]